MGLSNFGSVVTYTSTWVLIVRGKAESVGLRTSPGRCHHFCEERSFPTGSACTPEASTANDLEIPKHGFIRTTNHQLDQLP